MEHHGWIFWLYMIFQLPSALTYMPMNLVFIEVFTVECQRQLYVQQQLTYMVEYVNHRKSYSAIQNPVFNLLDPTSLLTWLDLRALMKDVGRQYKLRMQIIVGVFALVVATLWLLVIGYFFDYIHFLDSFRPDEWFFMFFLLFFLSVPLGLVLVPMAFMNEETGNQVVQFNEIRLFMARLRTDKDLL